MHPRSRRVPVKSSFAGFRFPPDVITLMVRCYLRYGLSYRDVEELLVERRHHSRSAREQPAQAETQRFLCLAIPEACPAGEGMEWSDCAVLA
jgi:hypothetical protein